MSFDRLTCLPPWKFSLANSFPYSGCSTQIDIKRCTNWRTPVSGSMARAMDPETGVRQLVHLLMSIWVEHPEYGKLLASENFHGGKHVKRSKLIGEMYQQLVDALNDLLRRGVEQGLFRSGIDAVDLYISISSLSAYYVAHQHTLNALFHVDVMEPRRLRQRENHIADLSLIHISEP